MLGQRDPESASGRRTLVRTSRHRRCARRARRLDLRRTSRHRRSSSSTPFSRSRRVERRLEARRAELVLPLSLSRTASRVTTNEPRPLASFCAQRRFHAGQWSSLRGEATERHREPRRARRAARRTRVHRQLRGADATPAARVRRDRLALRGPDGIRRSGVEAPAAYAAVGRRHDDGVAWSFRACIGLRADDLALVASPAEGEASCGRPRLLALVGCCSLRVSRRHGLGLLLRARPARSRKATTSLRGSKVEPPRRSPSLPRRLRAEGPPRTDRRARQPEHRRGRSLGHAARGSHRASGSVRARSAPTESRYAGSSVGAFGLGASSFVSSSPVGTSRARTPKSTWAFLASWSLACCLASPLSFFSSSFSVFVRSFSCF